MSSEPSGTSPIHIPPKYDQYGNRQLWFVETGRETFDNLVNGAITGFLFIGAIAAMSLVVGLSW